MGVSECIAIILINPSEEAYSVQLVKLGFGNVQAVAFMLK